MAYSSALWMSKGNSAAVASGGVRVTSVLHQKPGIGAADHVVVKKEEEAISVVKTLPNKPKGNESGLRRETSEMQQVRDSSISVDCYQESIQVALEY